MRRTTALWAAGKSAVWIAPLAACVVLSLGVAGLWLRSYSVGDRYITRHESTVNGRFHTKEFYSQSSGGGLRIMLTSLAATDHNSIASYLGAGPGRLPPKGFSSINTPTYPQMTGAPDDSALTALGIHLAIATDRPFADVDRASLTLTLPWWLIFIVLSCYPVLRYVRNVIRRQREDRMALGLCPCCGEPVSELLQACRGCDKPVVLLS
jgi:hypothetical protein